MRKEFTAGDAGKTKEYISLEVSVISGFHLFTMIQKYHFGNRTYLRKDISHLFCDA